MGDISRHRDIFLNTQKTIPKNLLDKCNLSPNDLSYLELGNYFTDVSQFRDPVFYIFAKKRIWREFIIPKSKEEGTAIREILATLAAASFATTRVLGNELSGLGSDITKGVGYGLTGLLATGTLLTYASNLLADIVGADEWIDKMFGTPLNKLNGDLKKRDEKHYGLVGQFFKHFIEGITHLLFAEGISKPLSTNKESWAGIKRIPAGRITDVFGTFFTQYFPHEHTDQPAYVWDASKRPTHPNLYGPRRRQQTLVDKEVGLMNIVDKHYIQYLSESLTDLENEYRTFKKKDDIARQNWLIKLGKILHGIEDWFFHSNAVELVRMRKYKKSDDKYDEAFLIKFVNKVSQEPDFKRDLEGKIVSKEEIIRRKRVLYRRLRFPKYEPGNKENSGGIISEKESEIQLFHAYPAFPSQEDTPHTLLHALKNLEEKLIPTRSNRSAAHSRSEDSLGSLYWAICILRKLSDQKDGPGDKLLQKKANARGLADSKEVFAGLAFEGIRRDKSKAVIIDVLREWVPLIVTLLNESERKRLVAGVDPLLWPISDSDDPLPNGGESGIEKETENQLERHKKALKAKSIEDGFTENNYERAVRYFQECGFINESGRKAIVEAFKIDQRSAKLLEKAPGCGGFLIKFGIELQQTLDFGINQMKELNKDENSIFRNESLIKLGKKTKANKGVFQETIGSHSLMSKDTLESQPFFEDAKVLASVASQFVFRLMLDQVSGPVKTKKITWELIIRHLIRFPLSKNGWENQSLSFYKDPKNNKKIPIYNTTNPDIPSLKKLVDSAFRSNVAKKGVVKKKKDDELKERYIELEKKLSTYRYSFF